MLNKIEQNTEPERVIVENLPDGLHRVVLHDNIEQVEKQDEQGVYTVFQADEVSFTTEQVLTEEAVEKSFHEWWVHGEAYTGKDETPTLNERLEAFEEFMSLYLKGEI